MVSDHFDSTSISVNLEPYHLPKVEKASSISSAVGGLPNKLVEATSAVVDSKLPCEFLGSLI